MGLLRFDTFMEHALYHPSEGYYAKRIHQVGADGDFSTSATLSNNLAKAIAQWIISEAEHHKFKKVHLIEVGAGNGQLTLDIYKSLSLLFRRKVTFHIVERSTPLKELQQQKLGNKVKWHDSPTEALKSCRGNALIYTNELVDAFPVRIFRSETSGYSELYIDSKTRSEHFQPAKDVPDSSYFETPKNIGVRFEVHESYCDWLHEWTKHFYQGSLLTIDYGAEVSEQIASRPKGSLRGYFRHQKIEGDALYQNVGHQDLTSDVNFTDLQKWGESLGMKTTILLKQREFLEMSNRKVDQYLSNPEGAGEAFQVLQQRK